ncbi:MAG TPA: hypothetical protein VN428_12015 [Bryobacteraceae bacterium]|nr:hypothetical protein [Bryobacteraceae bacterium]
MKTGRLLLLGISALMASGAPPRKEPLVWAHYTPVVSKEADFADLIAHGIGLVNDKSNSVEQARAALAVARKTGMKYNIYVQDITKHASHVQEAGLKPAYALMVGGAYEGKAIDRHLFQFSAGPQRIVIEPPVYNPGLPYTLGTGGSGIPKKTDPVGHYWPDMPAPVRAEIIVPLKKFDGKQHIRVVSATIQKSTAASIENDSVTPELPRSAEIRNRKLYELTFDLSGLDGAQLAHVGIAVYWPFLGSNQYWVFGKGTLSASAASTRDGLRFQVRKLLGMWKEANGGSFPSDVVRAMRYGDESFYLTGHTHLNSSAVSYPLWDYSETGLAAFRSAAGKIEHPRTWGFPEVYGPDAYGWWLYSLHRESAELVAVVREEIAALAPGLVLFRNTTRSGVFAPANDLDGTGPELLTRQLDIVHLDPYPAFESGYQPVIPRDMSYHAGLARRYQKPLIPWLQAHTYTMGKEVWKHVTPEEVDRMAEEHLRQGIDGAVWLGYCPDCTFPNVQPESWKRSVKFNKAIASRPVQKPKPRLAVLRSYRAWAQSALSDGMLRNPADWELQQLLEVWAVKHGLAYDIFEVPPVLTAAEKQRMSSELKKYPHVISTEPWPSAWVIGAGRDGRTVDPATSAEVQQRFEKELATRGWLAAQ